MDHKMNKALWLMLVIPISQGVSAAGFSHCSSLFFEGYAPIISNQKLSKNLYPLCSSSFAVNYSGVSKTALWSAEYTTPEVLRQAKQISRDDEFHEETRIPVKVRSLLSDFRGSGYDRGHLSPSASRPTKLDQYQSFSLSNIIPQAQKNNQNQWRNAEEAVRTLITKRRESAYVITGPLFLGPKVPKLGSGVLVPSHVYKVVFFPSSKVMSAYVSVNDDIATTDVVSVAQLQQVSGLVFFPSLNGSPVVARRYALPLSANAAYKMSNFTTKAGSSAIFEIMPDPSARPEQGRKNNQKNSDKKEIKYKINTKRIKEELKNMSILYE